MLFNMKITELYQKVVGVVIMVTGINENDILHSNREECADARYLLVRVLSDKLSDKETGLLIGRTRQGVSFIRSNDTKMRKWSVMSAWREIDDAIKNGGLSLFEGKVEFEPEDLEELKTLLKYNLPIQESAASYSVLTEEPTPQGEDADEK